MRFASAGDAARRDGMDARGGWRRSAQWFIRTGGGGAVTDGAAGSGAQISGKEDGAISQFHHARDLVRIGGVSMCRAYGTRIILLHFPTAYAVGYVLSPLRGSICGATGTFE